MPPAANHQFHFAEATRRLSGQPMFMLLAKARALERAGRQILHFELGEPDFNTPAHVTAAAIGALRAGQTHYTEAMGTRELRAAVQRSAQAAYGYQPDLEQILVTPAQAVLYLLVRCLVNPGDEVLVPDPGFPPYLAVLRFAGAVPVSVPLREAHAFRMQPADIAARVTKKTRLLILNSPQNPTGGVMTAAEMAGAYELAQRHQFYLLSDEVYRKMTYDETAASPSIHDRALERTIVLDGFSKAYAMTGWRLGYVIGPAPVVEQMSLLLNLIISCVPTFIQAGGVAALEGDQAPAQRMMTEYRRRRDTLVLGLNRLPGVRCVTPDGAIYAFPNITGTGLTSQQFSQRMLERAGVALLPGDNFGPGGEGYVRLCYATSMATIERALTLMADALRG